MYRLPQTHPMYASRRANDSRFGKYDKNVPPATLPNKYPNALKMNIWPTTSCGNSPIDDAFLGPYCALSSIISAPDSALNIPSENEAPFDHELGGTSRSHSRIPKLQGQIFTRRKKTCRKRVWKASRIMLLSQPTITNRDNTRLSKDVSP
eukprot:SAG31_NODE_5999_length_2220_cov_2.343706_2_plen_150_part_00